jgi:hypothetical protein
MSADKSHLIFDATGRVRITAARVCAHEIVDAAHPVIGDSLVPVPASDVQLEAVELGMDEVTLVRWRQRHGK